MTVRDPGNDHDEECDRRAGWGSVLLGPGPRAHHRTGGVFLVQLVELDQDAWSNPFFGVGDFFVSAEGLNTGPVYGTFIFLVTSSSVFLTPPHPALLRHHLHHHHLRSCGGEDQLLRL